MFKLHCTSIAYKSQQNKVLSKLYIKEKSREEHFLTTLHFGLYFFAKIKKAGDGNRTHVSSLEGWCSTIELHPHINMEIGVTGFEPATSWSQTRRSSQTEPHPDYFDSYLFRHVLKHIIDYIS